jgi:ABC-2 type transport system ATP-binding protein
MVAVKIEDLTKKFRDTVAINRLNLEIEKGRIVGIIGPDGAGKTTLLRLLTGLFKPTSGSISVDGINVALNTQLIKDRIGYMPQHFSLYGDLTVAENLRFFADLYGVPLKRFRERRGELLRFSGLQPFEKRLARNLSGGMQKKLALACNLFHTPEILFLDEPTTGVDPVSRRELWQLLFDLNAQGATLILTTPYMDEASKCHRVGLLTEGTLLTYESPQTLIDEMRDEVFELLADLEGARKSLKNLPGLKNLYPFGETLHLVFGAGQKGIEKTSRRLKESGIAVGSLKKISPSIEDVFLTLVLEQKSRPKENDVQHRSQ